MAKFMLSLRDENFQQLIFEAQERGITIQELIRAVIIPDWVKQSTALRNASTAMTPRGVTAPGNGGPREQIVQPWGGIKKPGSNYRQPVG